MTGDDWRGCRDLDEMLTLARRRGDFSARKRRLFACACCARLGHLLPRTHRRALAVAQEFADGRAARDELAAAWSVAYHDPVTLVSHAAWAACTTANPGDGVLTQGYLSIVSLYAANAVANRDLRACAGGPRGPVWHVERTRHRAALRDVAHPPRVVKLDAARLPPAAVAVARAIYEERRFADLPVMADALEEVGCAEAELVAHCRAPGEHVLGCWALDVVLTRN